MEGQGHTEANGRTVGEVLEALMDRYHDLRSLLLKGDSLNEFINIFINDDNIRALDGVATKVNEGDRVLIFPAVAGG